MTPRTNKPHRKRPPVTPHQGCDRRPLFVSEVRKISSKDKFTDAEMTAARETDLPDLLVSLGYRVRRIGSYYTTEEMDSLRIKNRRTWFRYSEDVGGDAITFLQRFHNMSFPKAVEYLLDRSGRSRDSPAPVQERETALKEEKVPFVLPPPNADHRRVFAYLRKRGIAAQVINVFLAAGLLYEDAEHHNCVFVGRNTGGEAVFASKRGTYDLNGSGFKGDIPASDKAVAFRLLCDPASDVVHVFEAPIDLMSYLTLHREAVSNAVALCCLHDGALATYLREHPHLKRIVLCLDADRWGQAAAERFKTEYTQKGYAVDIETPAHGKDWNEYLQQRKPARERGR